MILQIASLLLIGIRVLVFRIWVAHEHAEGTVLKLHVNVRASMCHVVDLTLNCGM
jgi:hypothetical protein